MGNQIRRWREEVGLSRQELVERLSGDIQYPRLSRIELGDVRVGPAVAARLGPILGFTTEELLAARDSIEVVLTDDPYEAQDALNMHQYWDEDEAEFFGTLYGLLGEDTGYGARIARTFVIHYLSDPSLREGLMPLYRDYLQGNDRHPPMSQSDLHRMVGKLSEDEASKVVAFVQGLMAARTQAEPSQDPR